MAKEFFEEFIPKWLAPLEKILQKRGGEWYAGSGPTFGDLGSPTNFITMIFSRCLSLRLILQKENNNIRLEAKTSISNLINI